MFKRQLSVINDRRRGCRLCDALGDARDPGKRPVWDIPFRESSSFVVIPALGPLCLGHSMIVSRDHHASLLSMDPGVRAEFEEECRFLTASWDGPPLLFAEHGSSCMEDTGACIAHTHVNVLPGVSESLLDLSEHGHELIADGPLNALPSVQGAYFLVGWLGGWSLYHPGTAPPSI